MGESKAWDVGYEWRAVLLMTLAFGLVGLDRFAINPLFPAMMKDLHLNYQDLGNISSVLSVAWGLSSVFMGQICDRLGRRRVLIPAILAFSAMAGLTGLATGIGGLLALRVIMGVSEGAFLPASITTTIEASKPSRRGLNFGLQQNGLPLLGLALGPIIATQLLAATGSWRWVYSIVAIPGFVVAFLVYKLIRDRADGAERPAEAAETAARTPWREVFRNRNLVLAAIIMTFAAGSLNVVIAMTPSYLVDYLKVSPQSMGFIVSSTGLGAVVGGILLPALSDRVGRRPIMLAAAAASALSIWSFMHAGASPGALFGMLALISGFGFSVIYITVGPLTVESAPAAIATTAVGMVSGVGEIVGGGIAPAVAGYIANHFGIEHVFGVALAGMVVAALIALGLKEPGKLSVGGQAALAS